MVSVEIRKRSARVQALQVNLDKMRALIEARAKEYADSPGGSTGTLVRDFRGKNAEQEIWKFDGALVAEINDTLKQAAIVPRGRIEYERPFGVLFAGQRAHAKEVGAGKFGAS